MWDLGELKCYTQILQYKTNSLQMKIKIQMLTKEVSKPKYL